MSIHDQWGSEKASDWVVTPSKVKLQPVKKAEVKKTNKEKSVLFVGLQIANAESLAIEGGENHEDFHVTMAYGYFDQGGNDEDSVDVMVQSAIEDIRDLIPDKIHFDAIGRFEASKSSDGKDVIYARVAAGQLEKAHDGLLKALKKNGIKLEDTFPEYRPHMTLAYIDPDAEYELSDIDASGDAVKVMIGHGRESSKENNYTIMKTDADKRLVFGWASISITLDGEQLEDRQQDIIDPEDLEEAAYEYVLHFRDTGEEHIPGMRKKGKMVESCVFTEEKQRAMGIPPGTLPIGWWIGFYIEDDDAWERVKNGTYKMFSIEGKAHREPVEKANKEKDTMAKSFNEIIGQVIEKNDPDRFDVICEVVGKSDQFDHVVEIEKYNPYHGPDGRFTSANGGGTVVSGKGKAIITEARTGKANIDKNVEKVRKACSNSYGAIEKEAVNLDKVKARGGCDDAEAKKCAGLADEVYAKAAAAEPKITKDVVSVVAENGGKMYGLDFRMKQPTSMAGKISSDAKDDGISVEEAAGKIKDSVRYTAVFESKDFVAGYNNVKSKLEADGYEEVRCKNYFQKYEDGTSCQKAVQCVYKNKEGLNFELQFHTYETQGAKEVNHKYYEEQRQQGTKARRYKALNDAMTKISSYSEVPDGVLDIKSHG